MKKSLVHSPPIKMEIVITRVLWDEIHDRAPEHLGGLDVFRKMRNEYAKKHGHPDGITVF